MEKSYHWYGEERVEMISSKSETKSKKLSLRRESLRGLTVKDLAQVRGGACPKSRPM
jgi:hypothetical protein